MRIRKHIILSNAAIVIIPIIITIAATFAFTTAYSRLYRNGNAYRDFEKALEVKYELFSARGSILDSNPQMLLDKSFQDYLGSRMAEISSEVVIIKGHETFFTTTSLNPIDIQKSLETENALLTGNKVKIGDKTYLVDVTGVNFTGGSSGIVEGKVIFLSPFEGKEQILSLFVTAAAVIFIISFSLASAISSVIFSRSIENPLSRLNAAVGEISRGNLDHPIAELGSSEIMELCRSFEQMRIKLKESVYLQMKYDDNRKMLVSSISHDLKTPITAIRGYVEGILDGVANSPDKVEKYLKTVDAKAAHMDSMIDDLLLYSRLDLKQIPFEFELTDVERFFLDCIAENETELEDSGISLTFHNSLSGGKKVMMDRVRMRRVVMNILDNSRKYINKDKGEIEISLRENNTDIVVEIRDNGEGIPKEQLPFVFDRFYRADAARRSPGGSGLGLAIAKQIVEGHQGKIWAKSEPALGTSIMILFRVVAEGGGN